MKVSSPQRRRSKATAVLRHAVAAKPRPPPRSTETAPAEPRLTLKAAPAALPLRTAVATGPIRRRLAGALPRLVCEVGHVFRPTRRQALILLAVGRRARTRPRVDRTALEGAPALVRPAQVPSPAVEAAAPVPPAVADEPVAAARFARSSCSVAAAAIGQPVVGKAKPMILRLQGPRVAGAVLVGPPDVRGATWTARRVVKRRQAARAPVIHSVAQRRVVL